MRERGANIIAKGQLLRKLPVRQEEVDEDDDTVYVCSCVRQHRQRTQHAIL